MMTRDQFVRQISQEQAALRRFLTALCCGNSTTADDMAQDTLLKAYMQLSQYDERGRFASWLMKIAYRVFIDNRRKLKSHAEEPIASAKIIQDAQQTDNTFRYQALYIALEALSEKVRITMLLHYMQGYQVKEDKFFKNMLADYRPQLSDDNAFMQKLQRQMTLIDEVKAYQQAQKQKNKHIASFTFAVGLLLGCIATLVVFTLPTPAEGLIFGAKTTLMTFLLQNILYIGLAIGAVTIGVSWWLSKRAEAWSFSF